MLLKGYIKVGLAGAYPDRTGIVPDFKIEVLAFGKCGITDAAEFILGSRAECCKEGKEKEKSCFHATGHVQISALFPKVIS